MNLMLLAILAFVAVGLLAPQFGRRQYWLVAGIAMLMTGLYFVRPTLIT